ncbi:hypothetical protein K438DRAFT_1775357 [Mycena galopus ATCC 62051]|nr:hypothetical protein K438DRAFT_1775357 [Mycena galopus ATCC 62051]
MLSNNIWVENQVLEAPVKLSLAYHRKSSDSEQAEEPTDPSETATFAADDKSEIVAAAGPSTVIESQAPISAQPSRKRLNGGLLKGWGVQHDGVSLSAVDYSQNHWDEFKEEYSDLPISYHLPVMIGSSFCVQRINLVGQNPRWYFNFQSNWRRDDPQIGEYNGLGLNTHIAD